MPEYSVSKIASVKAYRLFSLNFRFVYWCCPSTHLMSLPDFVEFYILAKYFVKEMISKYEVPKVLCIFRAWKLNKHFESIILCLKALQILFICYRWHWTYYSCSDTYMWWFLTWLVLGLLLQQSMSSIASSGTGGGAMRWPRCLLLLPQALCLKKKVLSKLHKTS